MSDPDQPSDPSEPDLPADERSLETSGADAAAPTLPGGPRDEQAFAAADLGGLDPKGLIDEGLRSQTAGGWEPPTPEELHELLPQYEIDALLGRGGMGAVYRGRQATLDRLVAIKLLPAEMAADEEFVARFEREARTLAKLHHPGIVLVHDFGQTSEGHLYFVMEFVDGTDLYKIIHGPGLDCAQALEIVSQICDALQYAHGMGVVHRDIKPANVIVALDGRAKLADFGLARPTDDGSGVFTQTNVVLGTPDYMAPEALAGEADHRADLYSLGVMLYEMLTGKPPRGAWAMPSERVKVDVRLDEVVIKALQEDQELRYQQASEIKTDVDGIRSTPLQGVKKRRGKGKRKTKTKAAPASAPAVKAAGSGKKRSLIGIAAVGLAVAVACGLFIQWALKDRDPKTPATRLSSTSELAWQPIQWHEGDFSGTFLQGEDGWIHSTRPDSQRISTRFGSPEGYLRDFGLRLRYRWTGDNDLLKVGLRNPGGIGPYLHITPGQIFLADDDPGNGIFASHQLSEPLSPGSEGTIELALVNNRVVARFNQVIVLETSLPEIERSGNPAIQTAGSVAFRDLEIASLNDLPDPLAALGWDLPKPVPAPEVIVARERGGRLRVFGNGLLEEVELGRAAEFSDFQSVVINHECWAARRKEGDTLAMFDRATGDTGEPPIELGPYFTNFLQRGTVPVMQMTSDGSYRNIFAGGSQHRKEWANHQAVAFLNPGNYILSLDKQGNILRGEHWSGPDYTDRHAPPKDFFLGATAFASLTDHYVSARPGLPVRSFNVSTGAIVEFPESIGDIVEMDAFRKDIILRNVSGQVFVASAVGELSGSVPEDLGPAIAVRTGLGMFAAQMTDGTWRAWGSSDDLVRKTARIGHAIDVDFHSGGPGSSAYMMWIEPVGEGATSTAEDRWTAVPLSPEQSAEAAANGGWFDVQNFSISNAFDPELNLQNGGVRFRFRYQGSRQGSPALTLRNTPEQQVKCIFYEHGIFAIRSEDASMDTPEFPRLKEGESRYVEFVTIGSTAWLRVDGKIFQTEIPEAPKAGTIRFGGGEGNQISSLEYIDLDDLSEAEAKERLGWDPGASSEPGPAALPAGPPASGRPWTGPMGHTYVPIDGLENVLFSTWETRVKDFEAFVEESGHDMSELKPYGDDQTLTWQNPGFEQTGDHPVVFVSHEDAEAYCRWLTKKERAAGRLLPGQVYRLPTDREWSAAMGVLDEAGDFPADRTFPENVLTWPAGTQPPHNAENLNWDNDDFEFTAPVGSGIANQFGLFDLLGNVGEMCADPFDFDSLLSIPLRGGNFSSEAKVERSSLRPLDATERNPIGYPSAGFRCVLDLKDEEQRQVQIALETAISTYEAQRPTHRLRTLACDEMVLLNFGATGGYTGDDELEPFIGVPVTHLYLSPLGRTVTHLKEFPLRNLYLTHFHGLPDLEPLRDLPLQWIELKLYGYSRSFSGDLSPLQGKALRKLILSNLRGPIDLEPLRGMPLEELHCNDWIGEEGTDFSPVKDAPLRRVKLPATTTLESLMGAIDWWGGTVESFSTDSWLPERLLRVALLSGEPGHVESAMASLDAQCAKYPALDEFGARLRSGSFLKARRLAAKMERFLAGDASALDGDYRTFEGHAYLVPSFTLGVFPEAKAFAEACGGYLVSVGSEAEHEFLNVEFVEKRPRLGLERTAKGRDGWRWVNGDPVTFEAWGPDSGGDGTGAALHLETDGQVVWYHGDHHLSSGNYIIEWDTPTPQPP